MTNQEDCRQHNLLVGVNEVADSDNLSNLERLHVPSIDAPDTVKQNECFNVRVEIGKDQPHPNAHDHFVQFITLYADDTLLTRTDFTAIDTCPRISVCVSLRRPVKQLVAYARCNRHGTWVGRKEITIENQTQRSATPDSLPHPTVTG